MIIKFELPCEQFGRMMPVHMYLPDDYMAAQKRYPVLYMFDGHNLFFDEDATYGRAWRLLDHLYALPEEIMVVGIECAHTGNDRLSEYAPISFYDAEFGGNIEAKGAQTMDFIVHTLKPYIDAHFPSRPERVNTWIAGSSCGGLMALYAACCYSQTFSKAAALSPYLVPSFSGLMHLIEKQYVRRPCSVYFSWGAREGWTAHEFIEETHAITSIANILLKKGVRLQFNMKVYGMHNEASWEAEADEFLRFLIA